MAFARISSQAITQIKFLLELPTAKYEISDREIPDAIPSILILRQAGGAFKTKFREISENAGEKKPRRTEVF
ncbi:hypothetical protein LZG75_11235 [Polynucleobacter sp. IMCC30063]|uniref:hypothetical protein n=1 Tax=unclassified Polynucleobacter TaxID=2640945 RepID=UPI001F37E789|nr:MULTISPECIES: hypothetical protein [unclassified Polynucleobacter]MCE7506809.1 hypothetical protein [Polynucleobacter sp. IMCC30063]MCE7528114.1 hypothetical protein [Polynucleobacter sp. IMCC 30228]MCE7529953.1 hypothetical protein [Polynucleobacter sp. IMCC 29146]